MAGPAATARLTGLARAGPGRVALEVDGRRWRVVPDEVVVRAGLSTGRELDRPTIRLLRRELRRAEALQKAGRTLARRDVSEAGLEARLRRAGVAAEPAREARETLRRVGVLDDERFASSRALALAERGWGNAAVEAKLAAEGAPAEAIAAALDGLAPERARAERLVEGLPARKVAALLARRGFDPDVVEAIVPEVDAEGSAGIPW